MAFKNDDDPMSGLLSGLSGIDANLFRKNESLASAKKRAVSFTATPPSGSKHSPGQPSPAVVGQGQGLKPSHSGQAPSVGMTAKSFSGGVNPYVATANSSLFQPQGIRGSTPVQNNSSGGGDPFLASQLDAFSGLDVTKPRSMRQMQEARVKPKVDAGIGQHTAVTPPSTAPVPATTGLDNFQLHDDLDLVFSQPASADGRSTSKPASSGSLVDLTAGVADVQPSPVVDHSSPLDDLLGVSVAHPPPAYEGPSSAVDDLDIFNVGSASHQPAPKQKVVGQPDPEAEYKHYLQRARSGQSDDKEPNSSCAPPAATTVAPPAYPSFEKFVPSAKPATAPVVSEPSTLQTPGANGVAAAAARSGSGVSTGSSQRGSFFAAYPPEPASSIGSVGSPGETVRVDDEDVPPPPPYEKVVNAQALQQQQQQFTTATAQKQAEKAAKWFMSTTKKLAKVAATKAKEVQQKLEQNMDQHNKQRRGSCRPDEFDTAPPVEGSTNTADNDYPDYYYDWATTLAGFNAADRQGVLQGMAEDEQRIVSKILLAQGISDGIQSSDPTLARQPSSDRPSSAPSQAPKATPPQEQRRSYTPPPMQPAPMQEPAAPQPAQRAPSAGTRSATASRKSSAEVKSKASVESNDLLGMNSSRKTSTGVAAAAAAPVQAQATDDLLGMHAPAATNGAKAEPAAAAQGADIFGGAAPASTSSGPLDDLLGGGAQHSSSNMASQPQTDDFAKMFDQPAARGAGGAGGSMIDFGDEPPVDAAYAHLYEGEQGKEGEPEMRRIGREKRLAETRARMQQKLAAKIEQENAEDAEKAAKVQFREQYKPKVDAWSNQKKDNIRALISTVHTVLWENSGWKTPGMTDLVDPQRVKKAYMRVNLIVHPDKVKQKGGTVEQITIADMVFDVMKVAYAKFEESELRR